VKNKKKTVLIFAAHPDDDVLGCGGTIAKFVKLGFKIHVVFLSDGESSREGVLNIDNLIKKRKQNAKTALKILGCTSIDFLDFPDNRLDSIDLLNVVKRVEYFIDIYKPSTVLTHYFYDLNIDHQVTHRAVLTACRPEPNCPVKELLFFEIPSSTEWNFSNVFMPNYYVDISKTLSLKKKALKIYKNEMRLSPHPRSIQAIENLSYHRGSTVGCKAAEAFLIGYKIK
jgi:N-acetylglucosamine malate deacetylase 1